MPHGLARVAAPRRGLRVAACTAEVAARRCAVAGRRRAGGSGAVALPALAIYFLYHPVVEVALRGSTPGKRLAGVLAPAALWRLGSERQGAERRGRPGRPPAICSTGIIKLTAVPAPAALAQ